MANISYSATIYMKNVVCLCCIVKVSFPVHKLVEVWRASFLKTMGATAAEYDFGQIKK